ncbi:Alpha/Beta hydrolase protein [Xylogone sp. PMI_703]|nr:Alpha/Beta hydrolase protein [Xylogone sp. PMI_703]
MAIFGKSKRREPQLGMRPNYSTPVLHQLPPNGTVYHPPNWQYPQQSFPSCPSQGWPATSPYPYQRQQAYVSQNHILPSPPPPRPPRPNCAVATILNPVTDMLRVEPHPEGQLSLWQPPHDTQYSNHAPQLCDLISSKFNAVITSIDGEKFSGDENELTIFQPPESSLFQEHNDSEIRSRAIGKKKSRDRLDSQPAGPTITTGNYFKKVNLYANSRLSENLPPLKLYIETFPVLSLAAKYSEDVYNKPIGEERETHVDADWKVGTKAMAIKSVPMDAMNTIIFAIRGTQSFMDWAVNLKSAPASPQGFLDDAGNLCHAGFLGVARKTIKPIAARLRHLLEENPSRSSYSLLITGHSAGGAVAALLYSHMLSTSPEAESELNILTGCFRRVHCITFGAPPISLLPLTKGERIHERRKWLFLSFVNEGDPVCRAEKKYVKSLLNLYITPVPTMSPVESPKQQLLLPYTSAGKSTSTLSVNKIKPLQKQSKLPTNAIDTAPRPIWPVPPATLSNAGRIVLLRGATRPNENQQRSKKKKISTADRMDEGVIAQVIDDQILRTVIWGDPMAHMMTLYKRRIEILATNAVLGRS